MLNRGIESGQDVESLGGVIKVGREKTSKGIVCVGADKGDFVMKAYYHQCVVVGFSVMELNQVSRFQAGKAVRYCCGSLALVWD